MQSNTKEVSAAYRADKAKFYASDKKPAKICTKARKRVSALSAFEDRQMLKSLGLDVQTNIRLPDPLRVL